MVNEIQYTSIKRVLDNILNHPLLKDINLETAIRYTIRFIALNGFPNMYKDNISDVEIHQFRGILPCDLINIIQVRDLKTGLYLRAMTDTFNPGLLPPPPICKEEKKRNPYKDVYIPEGNHYSEEFTFKTQGNIIFTSFPEGVVQIAYKSIPVDNDGFPLLIDNEVYLAALEAYIKKEVFTVLFDLGKITAAVVSKAETDYCFLAGELSAEFKIPSLSEVESMTRMFNTLIPKVRQFDNGFKHLGDREFIKKH